MRPNICGINAAIVSALMAGGVLLVTSNPSLRTSNDPETPGKRAALATISFAPNRLPALPIISSNSTSLLAATGEGTASGGGGGVETTRLAGGETLTTGVGRAAGGVGIRGAGAFCGT